MSLLAENVCRTDLSSRASQLTLRVIDMFWIFVRVHGAIVFRRRREEEANQVSWQDEKDGFGA